MKIQYFRALAGALAGLVLAAGLGAAEAAEIQWFEQSAPMITTPGEFRAALGGFPTTMVVMIPGKTRTFN